MSNLSVLFTVGSLSAVQTPAQAKIGHYHLRLLGQEPKLISLQPGSLVMKARHNLSSGMSSVDREYGIGIVLSNPLHDLKSHEAYTTLSESLAAQNRLYYSPYNVWFCSKFAKSVFREAEGHLFPVSPFFKVKIASVLKSVTECTFDEAMVMVEKNCPDTRFHTPICERLSNLFDLSPEVMRGP